MKGLGDYMHLEESPSYLSMNKQQVKPRWTEEELVEVFEILGGPLYDNKSDEEYKDSAPHLDTIQEVESSYETSSEEYDSRLISQMLSQLDGVSGCSASKGLRAVVRALIKTITEGSKSSQKRMNARFSNNMEAALKREVIMLRGRKKTMVGDRDFHYRRRGGKYKYCSLAEAIKIAESNERHSLQERKATEINPLAHDKLGNLKSDILGFKESE